MKDHLISASLEDYVEAIYRLSKERDVVKAIDLANSLNVKRSSVAEAIKNMVKKGLVTYEKNLLVLTPQGVEIAMYVIVRHNTLFNFFHKILKLEENEAELNACSVEHAISNNAFEALAKYIKEQDKN